MFKNIAILILIATNTYSIYYIYSHLNPLESVTVDRSVETVKPLYFYRVTLANGGTAEAQGYHDKGRSIDLVDDNEVTFTIPKDQIYKIEKVYYKNRRGNLEVTKAKSDKEHN